MNRRLKLVNRITVAAILGGLLFSVGEGLRLNPFGFQTELTSSPSSFDTSNATSHVVYGPLDVPSQGRGRSKRTFLQLDVPAFIKTVEPEAQITFTSPPSLVEIELVPVTRLLTRGPPATS